MGSQTFIDRIKELVSGIAWPLFLWSINMTERQYLDAIYEQEEKRKRI